MWIRRLSELTFAGYLGLVASDARAEPASPPSDDGLAEYRERFKKGMDLYERGAAAEAIAVWEPIYRDLGGPRGYRLAYDLGVAYAALDDASHAADRLQAFLNEVDSRRARGEPLGAAVTNEESDARERLARLTAVLGRVQVVPGDRPSVVRVDAGDPHAAGAIAWVTPGQHTITFDPQTPDQRTVAVEVTAGALVELVPPPPPAKSEPSTQPTLAVPASLPSSASGPAPMRGPAPELPAPQSAPFPPALIAISGGLTLATAGAAVALAIRANNLRDDDIAAQARSTDRTISPADRASFATARTWAYVAMGGAAGLAGVTAGLTGWYLIAKAHGEGDRRSPGVGVRLEGSRMVFMGSF
jgi:hypothetical protein